MNIRLIHDNSPTAGIGIFARFMHMLQNAVTYDMDKITFVSVSNDINPYDWIFEQEHDDSFVDVPCVFKVLYAPLSSLGGTGSLELSPELEKLKSVCTKIRIKKHISDWVDDYAKDFGDNCLGVHIRLGDMNRQHFEFGVATTNDYGNMIRRIIKHSGVDKVFIASDNRESLFELQQRFPKQVIFVPTFIRARKDNFETSPIHANINNPIYWEEAMKECLLLAKTNQLLCRVSNLAHAAIVLSPTITKIHRVNNPFV